MLSVTSVVCATVLTFVAIAAVRGVRRRSGARPTPSSDDALARGVSVAVAATVLILVGLLVASILTGRAVGSLHAQSALTVEIVGHQWWWEVHYDDAIPSRRVTTANEVHIPVGRPVVVSVTSRDVIHSFWIPNLQGKRDLIPGYTTAVWLQADRAGRFRGQCAEFCGLQHAHMALEVIADSDADFAAWIERMRRPAREPDELAARRGRDVFLEARCAACHTVRGTDAAGQVAPDLTHVGSRNTLGAGTLTNTPTELAAWIANPQHTKPGNQMPPNPLAADDLQALVSYLMTLQ